jgi:hypothetical protein
VAWALDIIFNRRRVITVVRSCPGIKNRWSGVRESWHAALKGVKRDMVRRNAADGYGVPRLSAADRVSRSSLVGVQLASSICRVGTASGMLVGQPLLSQRRVRTPRA